MLHFSMPSVATATALALGLGAAAPALAAPMTVQEAFYTFNGVTEGDFNSSQEVEGRLYVGGNLTGGTIQVGFKNVTPSPLDELIVQGSTTIGTINMQNGSDMTVGGNVTGNVNMNAGSQGNQTARIGGTQTSGTFNIGTKLQNQAVADPNFADRFPEIDFAAFVDESNYLAGLAGTQLVFSDPNNKSILGSSTPASLSVFNVDISALNGGTFFIDNRQSETLLINVSGTSGTFAGNVNQKFAAEHVIWNFYEAENIQVDTAIVGSVLAPLAKMSGFSGSTEGSVIAKEINLTNGELHSRPFAGNVPYPAPPPAPSAVPLPAGLPLLLAGLGAMAVLRRRR